MTPEQQQQVNAVIAFLERQCGNLAREGANQAGIAEALALENKRLREKVEELTPKDKPELKAVE